MVKGCLPNCCEFWRRWAQVGGMSNCAELLCILEEMGAGWCAGRIRIAGLAKIRTSKPPTYFGFGWPGIG